VAPTVRLAQLHCRPQQSDIAHAHYHDNKDKAAPNYCRLADYCHGRGPYDEP
jgi:hypothetical protein